jgi:hypothetical protein
MPSGYDRLKKTQSRGHSNFERLGRSFVVEGLVSTLALLLNPSR